MKRTLVILAFGLIALPVAVIVTMLLVPFWRWLEDAAGIETIGHSGPAAWCFFASYGGILILGALVGTGLAKTSARPSRIGQK